MPEMEKIYQRRETDDGEGIRQPPRKSQIHQNSKKLRKGMGRKTTQ